MKRRIFLATLTAVWMGVIFAFSAADAKESAQQSSAVVQVVEVVLSPVLEKMEPPQRVETVDNLTYIVRKGAHMTEYAVLCVLLWLTMDAFALPRRAVYLLAVCGSAIYAVTDEWHQVYVLGRAGRGTDVLFDTGGALIAVLVIAFVVFLRRRKVKKSAKS